MTAPISTTPIASRAIEVSGSLAGLAPFYVVGTGHLVGVGRLAGAAALGLSGTGDASHSLRPGSLAGTATFGFTGYGLLAAPDTAPPKPRVVFGGGFAGPTRKVEIRDGFEEDEALLLFVV